MSNKQQTREISEINFQRIIYGGLLGTSIVILSQILNIVVLDKSLSVAVYSFSVSVPLLSLVSFCYYEVLPIFRTEIGGK